MPRATLPVDTAVRLALSEPRFATYVSACGGDTGRAISLYGWNAEVSSAFVLPTHFAEVSIRNAACEALTTVYGPMWPWDKTFEQSLPSRRGPAYSPRTDLIAVRSRESTTGKVVAELKLAFWCGLFTARHTTRLWSPHLATVLPEASGPTNQVRERVREDLDTLRRLRNRIAHHEPIFTRSLGVDLSRALDLVEMRSLEVGQWVRAMERVSTLLSQRP